MDAHLFWLPVQKTFQNLAHTWEIRLIFCHLCHAMSTSKEEKEGHPSGWHRQWKQSTFPRCTSYWKREMSIAL